MNQKKIRIRLFAGLLVTSLTGPISSIRTEAATIRSQANVNIRITASPSSDKIELFNSGQTANLLAEENGWYQIEYSGLIGYTAAAYWSANTGTALAQVNIRQAAFHQAPILNNVLQGTEVLILGRCEDWLYVEHLGIRGFSKRTFWDVSEGLYNSLPFVIGDPLTLAEFALALEEDFLPTVSAGDRYAIISEIPGYDTSSDAVSGNNETTRLTSDTYFILEIKNGVYQLADSPTKPGVWINPKDNTGLRQVSLTPLVSTGNPAISPILPGDPANPIGESVVQAALKLIGAPYILGAESWEEGGFDCSGVTQFSYAQLGIMIPRRASEQWNGIQRKVAAPLPGDIIAFEKDGKVYHVGIYIGDNQMIHAPKPGSNVKLSDLAWWYQNSTIKGFLRPYSD